MGRTLRAHRPTRGQLTHPNLDEHCPHLATRRRLRRSLRARRIRPREGQRSAQPFRQPRGNPAPGRRQRSAVTLASLGCSMTTWPPPPRRSTWAGSRRVGKLVKPGEGDSWVRQATTFSRSFLPLSLRFMSWSRRGTRLPVGRRADSTDHEGVLPMSKQDPKLPKGPRVSRRQLLATGAAVGGASVLSNVLPPALQRVAAADPRRGKGSRTS